MHQVWSRFSTGNAKLSSAAALSSTKYLCLLFVAEQVHLNFEIVCSAVHYGQPLPVLAVSTMFILLGSISSQHLPAVAAKAIFLLLGSFSCQHLAVQAAKTLFIYLAS